MYRSLRRPICHIVSSLLLVALALAATTTIAGAQVQIDTSRSYRIVNGNSRLPLGISAGSQQAGAAAVQNPGGATELWHFVPQGNGQYLILNLETAEVLGISSASLTSGAPAVMWADNSTADHLWTFEDAGSGAVQLRNVNSGLLLGISGQSTASHAPAIQETAGGTDTLWRLLVDDRAYPAPLPVEVAYSAGDYATIHDPAMLKAGKAFYLFSTHDGIHMHESKDMKEFADVGTAFTTVPAWTSPFANGDLWAPDVSFRDGKYWMYFAASSFGSQNSAIGLATSTTAAPGSWVDTGAPVLTSASCPYSNAIDPGLVVDSAQNPWLVFGSYYGDIYMMPLEKSTGLLVPGSTCTFLARRYDSAMEGAYVLHHGGYYYLFISQGSCCQGVNSTYRIGVSRSTSVTGPYTDRAGVPSTDGGGSILLSTHGNIIGPGGESVLALPRGDLLVYHYYDGANNGTSTLGLNWLQWKDGWPEIRGGE